MYTAYAVQDDINEREIGFRAFMLYVIGNVLLANSHSKVRLGYLASLIQIDEIGSYDWGGAAYMHLIMSLDLVCRFGIDNGSKAVVGMWQVIEYWYYSYFRNGMHVRILEEPDQFPAINNWGPTYRHKVAGEAHCNLSLARQQIESRTRSSIVWLPWIDSTCIRINHPYVRKALELTSRRCILFGPLVNVWYLGERCRRQVTGVPSVPCDPPSHMNLNGCQTDILLQWYNSGGISVDALIRQVSEQQYTDYWARVSVGMLLPPTYRGVNVDFVGASGLKEDVGISQPMGATLNRSLYPPLSQVEAVVTLEANWVIPITCRNGEIFNLRVPPIDKDLVPHLPIDANLTPAQLKTMLEDYMHAMASMASFICKMNSEFHHSKDDILEYARQELNSHDISYSEYPEVVPPQMTPPQVQTRPSISREDVYVPHFLGESTDPSMLTFELTGEGSSSYGFY
ncbi:hypothetical protein IFM89_039385 [Coptis chinensis]|uniref:Aminotransferase-like plant mobile domain-containing protein n=1 Tax=Coptis chinensis TaxID=261450 RepID=A0A835HJN6_9MAGN|nr:hypothetical protein IFM89_039385 [Coptis chinensis]